MCWKYEWAKAYNNLTWALRHMKRTRNKKHVEKYPKAVESTESVITKLEEIQKELDFMIKNYGIKRKSNNVSTERWQKGGAKKFHDDVKI